MCSEYSYINTSPIDYAVYIIYLYPYMDAKHGH